MFTAFMLALTLTSVANVLVTMSIGPLFTALASRFVLGHRLATRTWGAIALAGLGIAWMYGHEVSAGDPRHLLGTLVALAVPLAAATNWTLLQHLSGRPGRRRRHAAGGADRRRAVGPADPAAGLAVGRLGARPGAAGPAGCGAAGHPLPDGGFRGARAQRARDRAAGPAGGHLRRALGLARRFEAPSMAVLGGGALVLAALAGNELLSLQRASCTA
jgi:hypothetical protein